MGSETISLVASTPYELEGGNLLKLRSTIAPVTVKYFKGGRELRSERGSGVEAGYTGLPPIPLDGGLAFDKAIIESSTAQEIKLYITRGRVEDDRTSGTVQVVDGSVARVMAGRVFSFVKVWPALASNYNHVQLWNPPGSGKVGFVNKIAVADTTGIGSFGVFRYATKLLTQYTDVPNKYLGRAASADLEVWVEQKTSLVGTELLINLRTPQNETKIIDLSEPILVPPGQGLLIRSGQVNVETYMSMQFYIEDE